ncbi:DUF4124 domain-containing protein [Thalassotalea euphylliae]|uniref:DUF4124 domain-containing protein n=1 Tax=Thalassotalea euphylliae TaxID=1655234 RepID=A0A3E0U791_9GAMM|nr:DUF4124 domain-containing protein [Thalassotalea euphylliae]REL32447.1 DUF4124 domain-containing protein [Thalassotalea euphylliae]
MANNKEQVLANRLLVLMFLTLSTSVAAFQSAEVYRWVDKDGNVHYSDMPNNPNAKLIFVQPGITSKADTAQFPEQVADNSDAISDQDLAQGQDQLAFREAPNSAESCRDLRVEMNKRSRDLNAGNPEKARQARIFLTLAEKLLESGNCQ